MPTKEKDKVQIGSSENLRAFKSGVGDLISRRQYFVQHIMPTLKVGEDFHLIKNRKSLSKSGSEKIATIYSYVALFEENIQLLSIFKEVKGLIAYTCTLYQKGEKVGQGRGSSTLAKNANDANKTIKMAQKSAFCDAVIRTSGLSDLFTTDLEDMHPNDIKETYQTTEDTSESFVEEIPEQEPITCRQMDLCVKLLKQEIDDSNKRQEIINSLNDLSKIDASRLIQSLLEKKELAF